MLCIGALHYLVGEHLLTLVLSFVGNTYNLVLAVLFNCAEPEAVSKALKAIHEDENLQRALKERGVLTGAYANRLTAVDPSWTMADSDTPQPFRNDLDPKMYSDDFVSTWVKERGCQVVGGCCGITPEHISYINSHLGDNYAVLDSND